MAAPDRWSTLWGVTTYRLVVEGELSDRFAAAFGAMRLEHGPGETAFVGEIADQAQLQGLIAHVADLGLAVRSFGPVIPPVEPAAGPHHADAATAAPQPRSDTVTGVNA